MNTLKLISLLMISISGSAIAQDKPAWRLYSNEGKPVKYKQMIGNISQADMIFFGEYHTNPISHRLQQELSRSLYEIRRDDLFFGAEMFESGNQLVLDEYLEGFYEEDKMLPEITQLWGNYESDYKPLLDFAKEKDLRFIATNIPRRYASMINKGGIEILDHLSPEALTLISPYFKTHFDPEVKCYADMALFMGGHDSSKIKNLQAAQAAKDATMAYFSLKSYQPGNLLLHFSGSYHSNNRQGIIWWINEIQPGMNIKSITTLLESEWESMITEEREQIADFIIVVPDNMPQTGRSQ